MGGGGGEGEEAKETKGKGRTLPHVLFGGYQSAEQVTAICRTKPGGNTTEDGAPCARSLSDAQRMRKVIMELVETERAYVKVRVDNWCPSGCCQCVCVCVCWG